MRCPRVVTTGLAWATTAAAAWGHSCASTELSHSTLSKSGKLSHAGSSLWCVTYGCSRRQDFPAMVIAK